MEFYGYIGKENAMKDDREKELIGLARRALDQSLAEMDAETVSRLAEARARAVQARPRAWAMPLGASIAVAVSAALLIVLWPEGAGEVQQLALEDVEILASEVDLDVLAELDFYRWLVESRDAG
jgi:hypothetical protein